MRGSADLILDQCVGPELAAALRACPCFGCVDERASDPLPPGVRRHVPTFEVTDTVGHAVLGVVADGELDETNDLNASPTIAWTQVPFPYQTNATDLAVTLPLAAISTGSRLMEGVPMKRATVSVAGLR